MERDRGYGNNASDVTMGDPQPSAKDSLAVYACSSQTRWRWVRMDYSSIHAIDGADLGWNRSGWLGLRLHIVDVNHLGLRYSRSLLRSRLWEDACWLAESPQ
jgi:hypothetical protein